MDKKVLEVALKKYVTDSSVMRIIAMNWDSASPKGQAYVSAVSKVTLKVILGNGRLAKKSFFVKKEIAGGLAGRLRADYNLFKSEASLYTDILRKMDFLMEEFEDTEGSLWCKLVYINQAEQIIVLEDLKVSGFKNVKRSEAQDLAHARLALRGLGRFHAMAKVLEERGVISKDDYNKPFPFLSDEFYIRCIVYGGKMALVQGMRENLGDDWGETADKLSQMSLEEFSKRIKDSGNFDDDTFKCLNHGDCWNNNMMFKYDWKGRPFEFRFVDYQLSHYNSPCVDVTYYMYTSIRPDVRHQNYKNLIELYHKSLTSSLERFGYQGCMPSLEDIETAMEQLNIFGLTIFLGFFSNFNFYNN